MGLRCFPEHINIPSDYRPVFSTFRGLLALGCFKAGQLLRSVISGFFFCKNRVSLVLCKDFSGMVMDALSCCSGKSSSEVSLPFTSLA